MKKQKALELLGGTHSSAAEAIGVSASAISQWPDVLPRRLEDRVLAALARRLLPPEAIGLGDTNPAALPDAPTATAVS